MRNPFVTDQRKNIRRSCLDANRALFRAGTDQSSLGKKAHVRTTYMVAKGKALRLVVTAFFAFSAYAAAAAQNANNQPDTSLEPGYKGQPLSHWIEILNGGVFSSRWWPEINEIEGGPEAQEAIEHIGAQAVPFLLTRIPERGAMVAFRVLGPAARSAIPQLVTLATNELAAATTIERPPSGLLAIGMNPLTVLGWIGTDSVPAISMLLSNYDQPEMHFSAIQALGMMGSNATPAVPALLPCLNDKNEMVAREAVSVLGQIHARQPAAFIALTNILQTRPALRSETLEALVGFGDEAVPVILRGLEGSNSGAHYIVGNAFVQKSPQVLTNAALLRMLADDLQSSDSEARDWSALMLRAADEQSRLAKPQHLAEQLEGIDHIRSQATNALRLLAPQLLLRPKD
jgi:hypothetical protein